MRVFVGWFALTVTVFTIAACQSGKAPELPRYRPGVTVKEVMKSMVEPSADFLWKSVGTDVSSAGAEVHAPKTDKDWDEVRRMGVTLTEAFNIVMLPGRHMAPPGTKSDNPGAELEPEQIEALVNQDRETFIKLAHALQDAAALTLKAIDAKDVEALTNAGGEIDTACEACHLKYWYPNKQ